MFSNNLSFLSSRNVSDQASHPYKTTGKIIVLYILIFKSLNQEWDELSSISSWSPAGSIVGALYHKL